MDRQTILTTLMQILEGETGNTYTDVREDQSLRENLGIDSVDLINLVVLVENQFNIRIESDELRTISTVGHLLDLLEAKIAGDGKAAA